MTFAVLLQAAAQAPDPAFWPGRLAGWEIPLTTLGRGVVVAVITIFLASRVRHWFERATVVVAFGEGLRAHEQRVERVAGQAIEREQVAREVGMRRSHAKAVISTAMPPKQCSARAQQLHA